VSRAGDIAQDTMPSITHLSLLRSRLRELDHALDGAALGYEWSRRSVEASLSQIQQEFEAYARVTSEPEEREAWGSASRPLEAVRQYAWNMMGMLESGDGTGARAVFDAQLRPEIDRADQAVLRLIGINTRQALNAAAQVATARRRAQLYALALDGSSILVAIGFAMLAFRAVRRHDRLLERRANELDEFASRVAHDIESPLLPATIALDRAAHELPDESPIRRAAQRGLRALEHVRTIIEDLLAFARRDGSGEKTAVAQVHSVVDAVIDQAEPAAASHRVTIAVEPFPDSLAVACAPGVLESVLSNLVRNALLYMGDSTERRIDLRVRDFGDAVFIAVSDTGPGLPRSVEDAIDDRAHDGGPPRALGLGLTTVKRLVEAHGGAISVESGTHGGSSGTTFWLELPKAPSEIDRAPSPTTTAAPSPA
jgi:signal transduction histidine kinase